MPPPVASWSCTPQAEPAAPATDTERSERVRQNRVGAGRSEHKSDSENSCARHDADAWRLGEQRMRSMCLRSSWSLAPRSSPDAFWSSEASLPTRGPAFPPLSVLCQAYLRPSRRICPRGRLPMPSATPPRPRRICIPLRLAEQDRRPRSAHVPSARQASGDCIDLPRPVYADSAPCASDTVVVTSGAERGADSTHQSRRASGLGGWSWV